MAPSNSMIRSLASTLLAGIFSGLSTPAGRAGVLPDRSGVD
ncbi:MAG TPA: hypothetical protein VN621_01050 [Arthrobacter sp.]|nr:hypothetical protein [Arthrobacter sp.]